MFFQVLCLSALGVIHVGLGTSEGGRKYRSLGRVNDSENSFRCHTEGFHPDARDCRTFYRCVDFASNDFFRDNTEPQLTVFRFECGEGTVFDPDFNICNHPRQTRRAECGAWNTEGGQNPDTYPSQDGQNGGYRGQQGNQDGYPMNYPGGGNQGGYPGQGGYPNESENQLIPTQQEIYPGHYPGSGGMPGQGGYPGSGGLPGQGYPGQGQGGYPGPTGKPSQGGYPGSGESQGQGGYPGPGGAPGQGGYPGSGGLPGQGYPGQEQGGYPGPTGKPGQGGYPGSGGYPGPTGKPDQGGYPGSGGYPGPTGKPGQGGYPGSGGQPGQGYPGQGQGGYPGPTGKPGQGGYPGSGGQPGQGYPGQGQGGYPGPTGKPDQGGYPGSGETQGQGGYPGPGGAPGQGGYPGSGGQPGQGYPGQGEGGYPGPTGKPDQGGYPGSGGSQGQGGYPGPSGPPGQGGGESPRPTPKPDQEGQPGKGENGSKPEENPRGPLFSGKCETPGFFSVPGSCQKFVRCVDYGLAGYEKFEFECNRGTAWDPKLQTCNYSNKVEGCGKKTPANEIGAPGPSEKPDQDGTNSTPSQSTPPYNNSTSTKPTTAKPETASQDKDPSQPPPGSSPCDQDKFSGPVKCEKDGFYPDPMDCSKFYRCADWGNKTFSVYYFECGPGTIWDPAIETCNHEKSVYPPRNCNRPTNESEPSTSPATSTKSPETSSEPSTTASVTNPEDLTTAPITSPESLTTNPTTSSEDSSTMATESSTPVITTPSSSTESTEPTTKSSSEGPTTPSEESTEGSTISQTDSTTSNPEQTESTTSQEMTTTRPSGGEDPNCPAVNEDQSVFVCPTGFRRHSKSCSTFYQCTTSKDTGDLNIMLFSCKNDTVYNERKLQCLPAEGTERCQQAQGRVYRSAKEEFSSVVYVSPYKRLCPEEGSFPYEGDCTRFYKCKKDTRGKIQGYLYQCPENYSFDEATGRCEKSSELPACGRSIPEVSARTLKWMKDKVPVDYSLL